MSSVEGPSFHEVAVATFRAALGTARAVFLDEGDHAVDAEDEHPEDWLSHDRDRALDAIEAGPERRAVDVGSPPIEADGDAHEAVEALLLREDFLGEPVCIVGEEAKAAAWDRMLDAPEGSLILVLDAIDGSGPYENLAFGYGTTLLALRRGAERDVLEGAAVANSSGFYVSMTAVLGVGTNVLGGFLDFETAPVTMTEPEFAPSHNDAVAVVAAKPSARNRARRLLTTYEGDQTTIYNTGGAPASIGLLRGRLGALVCFDTQTMWDAAYLPILASLGVPVFLLNDGQFVGVQEITAWFSHLTREPRGLRPVPPFVASRRVEYAGEILARIRGLGELEIRAQRSGVEGYAFNVDHDGDVIASSQEFARRSDMMDAIRLLKGEVGGATVLEPD